MFNHRVHPINLPSSHNNLEQSNKPARKMAAQPVAEVLTFPTDPAEFENDDRISFSRLDNKYIAVQESDGTEFEFDAQLKRWIPLADEDEEALIRQQQSAYVSADPDGYGDARPVNGNKRKQDDLEVSCECRSAWSSRTTFKSSLPSSHTFPQDAMHDIWSVLGVFYRRRTKSQSSCFEFHCSRQERIS